MELETKITEELYKLYKSSDTDLIKITLFYTMIIYKDTDCVYDGSVSSGKWVNKYFSERQDRKKFEYFLDHIRKCRNGLVHKNEIVFRVDFKPHEYEYNIKSIAYFSNTFEDIEFIIKNLWNL